MQLATSQLAGGGAMERIFVRILSVTLLVVGSLALAGTCVAVTLLLTNGIPAITADTAKRDVQVQYQPLSTVSATAVSQSGEATGQSSSSLRQAAQAACLAKQKLVKTLSAGQLEITVSECIDGLMTSSSDDERALNMTLQIRKYLDAARSDPQISSEYPPSKDVQMVNGYLQTILSKFDKRFKEAVARDDSRQSHAQARAVLAKASIALWGGAALSMFLVFLFIAFLIVAIRVEKHIDEIRASLSRPTP